MACVCEVLFWLENNIYVTFQELLTSSRKCNSKKCFRVVLLFRLWEKKIWGRKKNRNKTYIFQFYNLTCLRKQGT